MTFMEILAEIWFFPAFSILLGCCTVACWRSDPACRIILTGGTLYFLFRAGWEILILKEIPLESVPIRVDLLLFAPLDVLVLGLCLAILLTKGLTYILKIKR